MKNGDFNVKKMSVSDLNMAGYNPREIDDQSFDGLKASMDRFGIVQPIVWNKKSGNVVSGHQRLKVLLEQGVQETRVIVVDLDDVDEKALNVAQNNQMITGVFTDKLEDLIQEIQAGYDENVFHDLR